MPFFVYILLCQDGSYYTGYTKNVDNRARMHTCGKGARYTKMHKPKKIAYVEEVKTRPEAMKREKAIKRLTHQQKAGLIKSSKAKVSSDKQGQN